MVADRRVSKLIRPGRQEVNVVAMSHVLLCTWLADESSCLETAVSGDCCQDVASEYGNIQFSECWTDCAAETRPSSEQGLVSTS